MSQPAIQIESISKQYRLGLREQAHTSLREAMVDLVTGPWKRFKKLSEPTSDAGMFSALEEISLEVQPGEVVGLVGRNGAGKSTLLKILSRITEPTSGRAVLRGRVGNLLEVGTGFHPELSGRENIYLNGAILGMKRTEIDQKFDRIVDFSQIEKFLDTPVKRYSSGMYVRLAFAVAAHLEPEILLVDEVLAVGDTAFQKKCLGKMSDVARSGRTVLFVSHNMAAMKQLCDRCVWLDGGRVKMIGPTDDVIRSYLGDSDELSAEADFTPGDTGRVVFHRAWVSNTDGTAASELDALQPLWVNLDFEVRERVQNVDISAWLSTVRDTPVCFASLSDSHGGKIVPLNPGRYSCAIRIPENFLVPDIYKVTVEAQTPGVSSEDVHWNAIKFEVIETGSPMRAYREAWRYGCVFGQFDWALEETQTDRSTELGSKLHPSAVR